MFAWNVNGVGGGGKGKKKNPKNFHLHLVHKSLERPSGENVQGPRRQEVHTEVEVDSDGRMVDTALNGT